MQNSIQLDENRTVQLLAQRKWLDVEPGGELWSAGPIIEGVKFQYFKALNCGSGRELVGKNRLE